MLNGYNCIWICFFVESLRYFLTCFCALLLMNDQKTVGILHWTREIHSRERIHILPSGKFGQFLPLGGFALVNQREKSGLNVLICSIQSYRYPYTPPPNFNMDTPSERRYIVWGIQYPCLNFQNVYKCWKETVQKAKSSRVSQAFWSISGRWNIETLMQGTWGIYSDESKELNTPEKW